MIKVIVGSLISLVLVGSAAFFVPDALHKYQCKKLASEIKELSESDSLGAAMVGIQKTLQYGSQCYDIKAE